MSAFRSSSSLPLVEFENFYNFLASCSVDAGVHCPSAHFILNNDTLYLTIEDVKKRLLSKSLLLFSLRHKRKSYKNRLHILVLSIRTLNRFEKKLSIASTPPVVMDRMALR